MTTPRNSESTVCPDDRLQQLAANMRYPHSPSKVALALALLLKGYAIRPQNVIYSRVHMTQLAGEVHSLRTRYKLKPVLYSENAPATTNQYRLNLSERFAQYWLDTNFVACLGIPAQEWADDVIKIMKFSTSRLTKRGSEK